MKKAKRFRLTKAAKILIMVLIVALIGGGIFAGVQTGVIQTKKDKKESIVAKTDDTDTNKENSANKDNKTADDDTTINLSLDEWIGWKSIIDANGGLTTQSGSIYDKLGVKVNINVINDAREKELNTYEAAFTQSMLLDKYSIGKADKDKCAFPITAYILEKFKEYNGNDLTEGGAVKGGKFVPLRKTFEYVYDPEDEKSIERAGKLFKVKKNVTLITCQGVFVEGGAVIQTTEDDLPDDIKELVEMGAYTLEEALALCTENASKERRMLLTRPVIKLVGEDGSKIPQIQKFDSMYSEDDLVLDYLIEADDDEEVDEVEEDSETDTTEQDEEIDYDSMLDSLLDD